MNGKYVRVYILTPSVH